MPWWNWSLLQRSVTRAFSLDLSENDEPDMTAEEAGVGHLEGLV